MSKFEIDVAPFMPYIPLIKLRIHSPMKMGSKLVDVHGLLDQVSADGKINEADLAIIAAAVFMSPSAPPVAPPLPPVVIPPSGGGIIVTPPTPHGDPPETAPAGKVASIRLEAIRAVLSAQRFPREDREGNLMVDPNAGTLNYGTAVTVEATLLDANGKIIDTGAGGGHQHTTAFWCQFEDGTSARIGPGSGDALVLQGTRTIGAGGKNYDTTNGTDATFRLGFADVAVEGEFTLWAVEGGIKSNNWTTRVS